MDQDMVSGIKK